MTPARLVTIAPLACIALRTRDAGIGMVTHVVLNAVDLVVLAGFIIRWQRSLLTARVLGSKGVHRGGPRTTRPLTQPNANRSRSCTSASPRCVACSAMPEPTTRSAQRPPHHATSSDEEKHQTPEVDETTWSPAANAHLFKRRPASGSAPLPRATSRYNWSQSSSSGTPGNQVNPE